MSVSQSERLAKLEEKAEAQSRELERMHASINKNAQVTETVRTDLLGEIRELRGDVKTGFEQMRERVTATLDAQDACIDDHDKRLTAQENQRKGALAVLTVLFTAVGAGLTLVFDAIRQSISGG